jgi:plastocyanin
MAPRLLPRTRPLALLVPLVLVAGLTAGCGSDDAKTSSSTASKPDATATKTITIKDFAFGPVMATAKKGDTIAVVNADSATHTLTADDGAFDAGEVKGGAKATITLDETGSFSYHCEIHSYMKGTIQVTD